MVITKIRIVVVSNVEGGSCDEGRAHTGFQGAGNILLLGLSNDYIESTL